MATSDIRTIRRDRARQSSRWPAWAKLLVVLAALYAVYVLAGFIIAPGFLKRQIETRATQQLKRPVTVEQVVFNPFTLTVALKNFRVRDHDGQPLLTWKRLFVNLQIAALLHDEIHLADIELDGFSTRLFVSKNGLLNVADLAPAPSADAKKPKQWALRIDRLSVSDAEIDYTDNSRAEPFHTHVGPTTFALRNFRTAGGEGAPGVFSAATESGESLSWSGRLALAPLRSNGEFRLGQIALKKYAPFYDGLVRFNITGGLIDVQAPYEFFIQNNKTEIKISDASVHFHDMILAERDKKETFFTLKSLDVEPIAVDLQGNSVDIGKITLADGTITGSRDKTGLNLMRLAPENSSKPVVAGSGVVAAAPWAIKAGEIAAKNFSVSVNDQSIPHPTSFSLQGIAFSAKHLSSTDLGTPIPVESQATVADGKGTLALNGQVAPKPLSADLTFSASAISLAYFGPWSESLIAGRLTDGTGSFRSHVKWTAASRGPKIEATADLDANQVALADANGQPVAQWKALGFHGIDYANTPDRIGVAEVALTDPVFSLAMGKDHILNVFTLMGQPATPTAPRPAATPVKAEAVPRFISIDRVALNNANVTFTDQSIDPAVKTSVSQLTGTITGVTSAEIDHGDVDIKGLIDGTAPVAISGTANFLSPDLSADLKLSIQNSNLLPLGPYFGRFVGYQLSSGGLTVESRAKVAQRKLDSTSNVVVTNFVLGAATNSPVAPHVPIHLALALLRDAQGRIVLDLPVQGNLDDPKFAVGDVIWKLVRGLIEKAATSPFSLIGAVFGGGNPGDDLSFQAFAPGSSDLGDQNTRKLDVVSRAMHERPTLHLAIIGSASPTVDLPPLREAAFTHRLQAAIYEEGKSIDTTIQSPDQVVVGAGAEGRLIAKWYQAEFMKTENPAEKVSEKAAPPVHRFFLARWFFSEKKETPAPSKPSPQKNNPTAASEKAPAPVLPPLGEMRERLLASLPIGDSVLADLAKARAQRVQQYVIEKGQLEADRVSVEPLASPKPSTRATLELR